MLELIFAAAVACILVVLAGRWGRAVVRRIRFIRKLKKTCEARRYRFRRVRNPLASFFCVGRLPDFIVSGEKEYCVRLITTVRRGRYFHFIDEQYAASHGKGGVPLPMAKKLEEVRVGESFHYFPEFELPREMEGRTDVEPIMLFNPVPAQITALNVESRERSQLITSGGKIGRFTVYAGSAFCDMLEGKGPVQRVKNQWWGE